MMDLALQAALIPPMCRVAALPEVRAALHALQSAAPTPPEGAAANAPANGQQGPEAAGEPVRTPASDNGHPVPEDAATMGAPDPANIYQALEAASGTVGTPDSADDHQVLEALASPLGTPAPARQLPEIPTRLVHTPTPARQLPEIPTRLVHTHAPSNTPPVPEAASTPLCPPAQPLPTEATRHLTRLLTLARASLPQDADRLTHLLQTVAPGAPRQRLHDEALALFHLCSQCTAGELLSTVAACPAALPAEALSLLLGEHRRQDAMARYALQLLWRLLGDPAIPDALALFPGAAASAFPACGPGQEQD